MAKNGVVYTPQSIVQKMLGDISFNKNDCVLEPSCGEGVFIADMDNEVNITAFDIDIQSINKARENSRNKKINFVNDDFLFSDKCEKYDVIIGNPPYIRVQDLNKDYLKKIKDSFSSCKTGSVDYYYAFIEKSLSLLKDDGVLSFIVPNSWLINKSAKKLRNLLLDFDVCIHDFLDEKVFDGFDIYTCILKARKRSSDIITIVDKNGTSILEKKDVVDVPWIKNKNSVEIKMPDIKNGIATLSDKCFIFHNYEDCGNTFKIFSSVNNGYYFLEKEILKPIVKASTMKNGIVIFPYKDNGLPYTEQEISSAFPLTYNYMLEIKKTLVQRDYDREWFLFGRSQGTKNYFGKKIAISSLVEDEIKYKIIEDENTLIYSGLYILTDSFKEIESILTDKKLIDFIKDNGKKMSSGWVSFSKTLLSLYFS